MIKGFKMLYCSLNLCSSLFSSTCLLYPDHMWTLLHFVIFNISFLLDSFLAAIFLNHSRFPSTHKHSVHVVSNFMRVSFCPFYPQSIPD